jgi:DNA-binding PadR family transcriptional regulator
VAADPLPGTSRAKLRDGAAGDRDGELLTRLGAPEHLADVVAKLLLRDRRHDDRVAVLLPNELEDIAGDGDPSASATYLASHACSSSIPCASIHGGSSYGRRDVRIDKDLVAASATPLVLAILADGESYGYAILKRVRVLSQGELEWSDGMLYPLLHRLGRLGYVTTEWRTPAGGRRRRYYALTDEGRTALADHRRQWAAVTRALDGVWPGPLLSAPGEA